MRTKNTVRTLWLCLMVLVSGWLPGTAGALTPAVTTVAVSFTVQNRNRTLVPCLADGRGYQVKGHLVYPQGTLPSAVTLYLHGLGFGEFFWRFDQAGYDFAHEMALQGHASLVIDRVSPIGAELSPASIAGAVEQQSATSKVMDRNLGAAAALALAAMAIGNTIKNEYGQVPQKQAIDNAAKNSL